MTTDVKLRAPEPEDLEFMLEIENDMQAWEHSSMNTGPYSRFQLKRYIEENANDIFADRQLRLVIETPSGEFAGMVDLFDFDVRNNRVEIGIIVLPPYRGCGMAASAVKKVETLCSGHIGMKQLYCHVRADNEAARSLFIKQGFLEAGTLKSWIRCGHGYFDVVVYQKILAER